MSGIERRFLNLLKILSGRGIVSPVLVIPSSLVSIFRQAHLLPEDPDAIIEVKESGFLIWLGNLSLPRLLQDAITIFRSRVVAYSYRKIWKKIQGDSNAVVHVGMNCSALRPPDVPLVLECVDANLEQFGTRYFRRASRHFWIGHCQTERIKNSIDQQYHESHPRWKTVANPTYFAQYEQPSKTILRDSNLVVFVGRLAAEKNPLIFLEAVAMAHQQGCDFRAIILGNGPLKSEIEQRILVLGLSSHVSVQFSAKPFDILQKSAIYVSLQPGDNYGSQSLLEAMGAGCAIVASDVGETKKLVTPDVGKLVELNADSVAQALILMLKSPEETALKGQRARYVAITQYSAEIYASYVESLYDLAVQYHKPIDEHF